MVIGEISKASKSGLAACILFALAVPTGVAAAPEATCKFAPLPPTVCQKSASRQGSERVNRRLLVNRLLRDCSLFDDDLDATGADVSYSTKVSALLDRNFCSDRRSCSKGTDIRLSEAYNYLLAIAQGAEVPVGTTKRVISLAAGSTPTDAERAAPIVARFLQGAEMGGSRCLAPNAPGPGEVAVPPPPDTSTASKPLDAVALRKNITDLPISRDDPKYKGIEKGSIAFNDDFLKGTATFNIDLAAGYNIGPYALTADQNSSVVLTPFIFYHQQYVDSSNASQNQKIFNVGGGLLSTWELFGLGLFQVSPKYAHAIHADADIVTGNLLYTPPITIAGIGGAAEVPLTNGAMYYRFTPQLQVTYGDVTRASNELSTIVKGEFGWIGPRLSMVLYGANIFEGFTYNFSYVYLYGFEGAYSAIQRLENSLNYALSSNENWSLQLKYIAGKDLDTLQRQNIFTLGVGVKY